MVDLFRKNIYHLHQSMKTVLNRIKKKEIVWEIKLSWGKCWTFYEVYFNICALLMTHLIDLHFHNVMS